MSTAVGKFIDERESDTESNSSGPGGDQSGTIAPPEAGGREPEFEYIEPSTVRIDADPDEPKRTRDGRIDGRSKQARQNRQKVSGDLKGLSIKDLLIGIHSMGAALTGIEELELDDEEAKKLADATQELGNIYGHSISPKTMAWTNFAAACGVVYGPRIIAYRERIKQEKAKNPALPTKPGPVPVANKQAPGPSPKVDPFPTPTQMWPEAFEGF